MSDTKEYHKSRGQVYWAKTNYERPDEGFKGRRPNLQVTLIPDNPEEFTSAGVALKEGNDRVPGSHIKITTKFIENPLNVQDAHKNKLPHDFLIGNGSVCNILWKPWKHDDGVAATLLGVQVIDHVAYVPEGPFDEVKDGGFDFSAAGSPASTASDDAAANDGL